MHVVALHPLRERRELIGRGSGAVGSRHARAASTPTSSLLRPTASPSLAATRSASASSPTTRHRSGGSSARAIARAIDAARRDHHGQPEPHERDDRGADRRARAPRLCSRKAMIVVVRRCAEDRRRLVERALVEHPLVALVEAAGGVDDGQQDGDPEHRPGELAGRRPRRRERRHEQRGDDVGDDHREPVRAVAAAEPGRRRRFGGDAVRRGRARLHGPPAAGDARREPRRSMGGSTVVWRGHRGVGSGNGGTDRRAIAGHGRARCASPFTGRFLPVGPPPLHGPSRATSVPRRGLEDRDSQENTRSGGGLRGGAKGQSSNTPRA